MFTEQKPVSVPMTIVLSFSIRCKHLGLVMPILEQSGLHISCCLLLSNTIIFPVSSADMRNLPRLVIAVTLEPLWTFALLHTSFEFVSKSQTCPLARPSETTLGCYWFYVNDVMRLSQVSIIFDRMCLTEKHLSIFQHTYTILMSIFVISAIMSSMPSSSLIIAIWLGFIGSQSLIVPELDDVAKKPRPIDTRPVICAESASDISYASPILLQSIDDFQAPKFSSSASLTFLLIGL